MGTRRNEDAMHKRFADNLWWARTLRRVSQEALAYQAEIHRTQISLLESGTRAPKLGTLVALAGGLDVPVEELLAGIDFESPAHGIGGYLVEPFEIPTIRRRGDG
jgi:transcriptional regulator with XRE-family HTH domain